MSIALGIGLSSFTWYSFFTYDEPVLEDLTPISGTVSSIEELSSSRDPFLELYLNESNYRFRVGTTAYREHFARRDFFRNVRPGDRITLHVEKAQLEAPFTPRFDPRPIVFIRGLEDEYRKYANPEDWIAWSKRNRSYSLLLGIVFPIATIFLCFVLVKFY